MTTTVGTTPRLSLVARYFLRNTFICSSDNYFTVNPFEKYVYQSYLAVIQSRGHGRGVVKTGAHDVITSLWRWWP